jgi:hypothetical protein
MTTVYELFFKCVETHFLIQSVAAHQPRKTGFRPTARWSPPFSAGVKNAWSYISTPIIRLHGVVLRYEQGQLHVYLTLHVHLFMFRCFFVHLTIICQLHSVE